jgi:hypothetical protein
MNTVLAAIAFHVPTLCGRVAKRRHRDLPGKSSAIEYDAREGNDNLRIESK